MSIAAQPRFSLSLHDLRSSMANDAVKIMERVIEEFHCPVTFHIVFDEIPDGDSVLVAYLRKRIAEGRAEVVFHGLSHACPRRGGTGSSHGIINTRPSTWRTAKSCAGRAGRPLKS